MKRCRHVCGAKLVIVGILLTALCGCGFGDTSVTNFFEFVQTVLLGVTAAGSVAILRNI